MTLLTKISHYKDDFILGWLVFFIAFFVRFGYLHLFGVKYGSDSSFYENGAKILLQSHFSFSSLGSQGYAFFYWLYPLFLAPFHGNHIGVALIQIVLHSIAAVLIFRIATNLFNRTAGIFAGLGYALFWEAFQWDMYILTDSFFLFLIILSSFLALAALNKQTATSWVLFGLSALSTIFVRPTVFPFLGAVALFLSWNFSWKYKLLMFFSGTAILGWILHSLPVKDAGSVGISPYFRYFASLFEKGIIVHDRPFLVMPVMWTHDFSFLNVIHFIEILTAKLIAFWLPIVPEFSPAHKAISILTFTPLLLFGAFGILESIRYESDGLKRRFIFFMLLTILFFWVFQAFTEIDYDWRYRLPVLPFLVIFASYGFSIFLKKLYQITLKSSIKHAEIAKNNFSLVCSDREKHVRKNIFCGRGNSQGSRD